MYPSIETIVTGHGISAAVALQRRGAVSGSDLLEVHGGTIYKAYDSGLCEGISPQNGAKKNMVEIVSIYPEPIPVKWDEYRTKPVAAFKTPKDEPISQQVTISSTSCDKARAQPAVSQ